MASLPHPHHTHHHEPDVPEAPGQQPVEPDEGAVPPEDRDQDGVLEPKT
ncbi:MAG TPA: hypothetical protein VLA16_03810 [Ideonella sp.]|nr:hypothetical protein [Ideonella sp.]